MREYRDNIPTYVLGAIFRLCITTKQNQLVKSVELVSAPVSFYFISFFFIGVELARSTSCIVQWISHFCTCITTTQARTQHISGTSADGLAHLSQLLPRCFHPCHWFSCDCSSSSYSGLYRTRQASLAQHYVCHIC